MKGSAVIKGTDTQVVMDLHPDTKFKRIIAGQCPLEDQDEPDFEIRSLLKRK